jgi:hypothetical protein
VDIGSLDDMGACIDSYLCKKEWEIAGSLYARDEEQSVYESSKKVLFLGQLSLKGVSAWEWYLSKFLQIKDINCALVCQYKKWWFQWCLGIFATYWYEVKIILYPKRKCEGVH